MSERAIQKGDQLSRSKKAAELSGLFMQQMNLRLLQSWLNNGAEMPGVTQEKLDEVDRDITKRQGELMVEVYDESEEK